MPRTRTAARTVPASAWTDAPDSLLVLGLDLPDTPEAAYVRHIGAWIIFRAGPAKRGDARYWAGHTDDTSRWYTFRLFPDGSGSGTGPSGQKLTRLRRWKDELRVTR